jgi:hypothetical protein
MDRRQFMKTYDTNQNGVVDRAEARRFVSRSNNAGQSFTIDGSSRYRETNARHSLVRSLLDADGDESLSAAELVEAETRLRLRDANDDGIVSLAELDDTLAGDSQAMMTAMQYRNSPAAMRLGPLGDWDGVVFTLAELYLRHGELPAEGFPLTPKLAAELDADGNGALNREELQRLDKIEPHIVLAVRFGRTGAEPAGISVERLAPGLGDAAEVAVRSPGGVMLKLAGVRMRFQFADRQGGGAGAGPSADEQLAALDEDKNGYLEKAEVEKKSPGTAAMFDDWDANGDGMVYAREIASYDRGRSAPQATAIRIAASDDQDALFPCLDADFDGRLTARDRARGLDERSAAALSLGAGARRQCRGRTEMVRLHGRQSRLRGQRSRVSRQPRKVRPARCRRRRVHYCRRGGSGGFEVDAAPCSVGYVRSSRKPAAPK